MGFGTNSENDESITQISCFPEDTKKDLKFLSKQVPFEGDLALTSGVS